MGSGAETAGSLARESAGAAKVPHEEMRMSSDQEPRLIPDIDNKVGVIVVFAPVNVVRDAGRFDTRRRTSWQSSRSRSSSSLP